MSDHNPPQYRLMGRIRCPECLYINPSDAVLCADCGAALVDHVPQTPPERSPLVRDTRWMKGYAVLTYVIAAVLVVVALGFGVYFLASGEQGRALYALLTALTLTMLHILFGRALWLRRRWGLKAAVAMHGTLLFYLIAQVVRAIWHPNIPYLDELLRPAVGLIVVGVAMLWIALTDRGLQADGEPVRELPTVVDFQRVKNVPYDPRPPRYLRARNVDPDEPPWAKIPPWLMLLGGFFLTRIKDAGDDDDDDRGSGGKKRRRKKKGGPDIKDLFKMIMRD